MLDNFLVLTALRARLNTVIAADTGSTVLGSSGHSYTRSTGSFLADGFLAGMEVLPAGFSETTPTLVTRVTDSTLYVESIRQNQAVTAGRRLSVGIPLLRGWENMKLTPEDRRWYIEEDYIPGAGYQATLGRVGELHIEPLYVIRLYGIAGEGVRAIYKVADAILTAFRPRTALALGNGETIRVRSDMLPYRGQVMPEGASHAMTTITIPLWARTYNNGD